LKVREKSWTSPRCPRMERRLGGGCEPVPRVVEKLGRPPSAWTKGISATREQATDRDSGAGRGGILATKDAAAEVRVAADRAVVHRRSADDDAAAQANGTLVLWSLVGLQNFRTILLMQTPCKLSPTVESAQDG